MLEGTLQNGVLGLQCSGQALQRLHPSAGLVSNFKHLPPNEAFRANGRARSHDALWCSGNTEVRNKRGDVSSGAVGAALLRAGSEANVTSKPDEKAEGCR